MAQKKWTPKRAKNALVVVLDSSPFPTEKGVMCCSARKSRQQVGLKAYIYIHTCCEVIIWSKFGLFNRHYLVQVRGIIWSKVIFELYLSGFRRFFAQLSFCVCVCFLRPIICHFSKKLCFLLSALSLPKEKSLFLCLLKHSKSGGFSQFLCFLLVNDKKGKKNDNWNFRFCFLSKNGRFVTHIHFSKNALLKSLCL